MKASLNVGAQLGRTRDASPASNPLPKINNELTKNAGMVCMNRRLEPAITDKDMPIQGVSSGATRMPKINKACALKKNPSPRNKPEKSANTKSSYDGKVRRARCSYNAVRPSSSAGKYTRR